MTKRGKQQAPKGARKERLRKYLSITQQSLDNHLKGDFRLSNAYTRLLWFRINSGLNLCDMVQELHQINLETNEKLELKYTFENGLIKVESDVNIKDLEVLFSE